MSIKQSPPNTTNELPAGLRPGQTFDLASKSTKLLALIAAQVKADPALGSEHSQRAYRSDLEKFETWRAGRMLTKTLVEAYIAELQGSGLSVGTVNRHLGSIRWWVRRLADLCEDYGLLPPEQVDFIIRLAARLQNVKDIKGQTLQAAEAGRHIPEGELKALLSACESDLTPAGARDLAMIALAWATGLRQAEISGLQLADLTLTGPGAAELLVHGKGRKDRKAYLNNGAFSALADWLALRGDRPGPLFCTIAKAPRIQRAGEDDAQAAEQLRALAGKIRYKALSAEMMRLILGKRIEAARIAPCTWHDFRRTFAGNLWASGVDGVTIQKLMGHSSQNQTAAYDRRGEQARKDASQVLHVPYLRRL